MKQKGAPRGGYDRDEFMDLTGIDPLLHVAPAQPIAHEDWELLAVSDVAPHIDKRFQFSGEASNRGYAFLEELHVLWFGKGTLECGCDR